MGSGSLTIIKDKKYGEVDLIIDNKQFENCEFFGTNFIYSGGKVGFGNCNFHGICWTFDDEAATTISLISKFYNNPGTKELAEMFLDVIKKGNPVIVDVDGMKEKAIK